MGKTTLLNVIMNKYKANSGSVSLGYHVTPAFFQQDQNKSLSPNNSIIDEVEIYLQNSGGPCTSSRITWRFSVSGEDVYK